MHEKVMEILKGVASKTKSKTAKSAVTEEDMDAMKCAAHCLFDECMEMYCEGDMSWKEMVDDLSKNLMAIEMPKEKGGDSE